MLIDGEENQETNILEEAGRRSSNLILVLDLILIHVLSYLWQAGFALCRKNAVEAEAWVVRFLFNLLSRPVEAVIADIKRSVAHRGLSAKERKPVDKCLKYFDRHDWMMRYPEFLAQGHQSNYASEHESDLHDPEVQFKSWPSRIPERSCGGSEE